MASIAPFSSFKRLFAASIVLCMLGWFSVFKTLHSHSFAQSTNANNCPPSQLQEWKDQSRAIATTRASSSLGHRSNSHPQHRLRVLMGIFTFDKKVQWPYRRQYRKLFEVFKQQNDTRLCSLYDFIHAPNDDVRYECQFIYTFVVGGLTDKNARTELVDDSAPILMAPDPDGFKRDNTDITVLNIQENMNAGKSQTWFYYASTILEKYDLDYAGKIDSDSLPYMDKFFQYAYTYLPPPPYNSGIIAGVPIDKLWWQKSKKEFREDENEDFFKQAYGKVMHLYAAGQCYILSADLCKTVALEAPKSHGYREGHEDHDVSAMAFHSTLPMSFHFLSLQQQFWKHPVKRYSHPKQVRRWRTTWYKESVRLSKVLQTRQEHLKAADHQEDTIPDQLAAPVQLELEDKEEGEEEEDPDEEEEASEV